MPYENKLQVPRDILKIFQKKRRFFLATHINPDGDALGSVLGLALALKRQGKEVHCYIEDDLPYVYRWLPGNRLLQNSFPQKEDYISVILDCSEEKRIGKAWTFVCTTKDIVVIDHHKIGGNLGTLRWIEPIYATGGLIFHLLKELNWEINKEIATNLYVAIVSDTGNFRFSQTTVQTFEVAKSLLKAGVEPGEISRKLYEEYPLSRFCLLQKILARLELWLKGRVAFSWILQEDFKECLASKADLEDLVSFIRGIKGVEISILLKEYRPQEFSVSLRSKGYVDVASLAQELGGGGHKLAAGFLFKGTKEELLPILKEKLEVLFL